MAENKVRHKDEEGRVRTLETLEITAVNKPWNRWFKARSGGHEDYYSMEDHGILPYAKEDRWSVVNWLIPARN